MIAARLVGIVAFACPSVCLEVVAAAEAPPARLAVLAFEDRSEDDAYLWLSRALRDLFAQEMHATEQLQIVATAEAREVMGEQDLALTGIPGTLTRPPEGQLVKADVILRGHYQVEDDLLRVEATISDAQSETPLARVMEEGTVGSAAHIASSLTLQLLAAWGRPLSQDDVQRFRGIPRPPFDLFLWFGEGHLYLQAGDLPEAWYCLRRAADIAQDRWPPRYLLVRALVQMRRYDQAEQELREALTACLAESRAEYEEWKRFRVPGAAGPALSSYREYAELLAGCIKGGGRWDRRGLARLRPGRCFALAGMSLPDGFTPWDVGFANATDQQLKAVAQITEHSFLAEVNQWWLDRALQRDDLPAGIKHWRGCQRHAESALAAIDPTVFSDDRRRPYLDPRHRIVGFRRPLAVPWQPGDVTQVLRSYEQRLVALARRRGVTRLEGCFRELGLPIVHVRSRRQGVELGPGLTLLLAPKGYGIESVTGPGLTCDPLAKPARFVFQPLLSVTHAPVSALRKDRSYRAAVLQEALVVEVTPIGTTGGAGAAQTVTVGCVDFDSAGTLHVRSGRQTLRIRGGQHEVTFSGSDGRGPSTALSLVPGRYDVEIYGLAAASFSVASTPRSDTWLDVPELTRRVRHATASRPTYAAPLSLRRLREGSLAGLERIVDVDDARRPAPVALRCGVFISVRKDADRFLLSVTRDLVHWSDESDLTAQLPLTGQREDVHLFEDRAGRFVLSWFDPGRQGVGRRLRIAWSTDLRRWTQMEDAPGFPPYQIAQAQSGVFVLVYHGGWVSQSDDLLTWSSPRHVCNDLFAPSAPFKGDDYDGDSRDGIWLFDVEDGLLHAFVANAYDVLHPDPSSGSVLEPFRHFFVAHLTSRDGRIWSEPECLYSEKARRTPKDRRYGLLEHFAVERVSNDGFIGALRTARTTDPTKLQRSCPQAAGAWVIARRNGKWFTTAEHPSRFGKLPEHFLYVPDRDETWVIDGGAVYRVAPDTLAAFTEPFRLPPASLDQFRWVEPDRVAASSVMLMPSRLPVGLASIRLPVWATLVHYLNAPDATVLKMAAPDVVVEPSLGAIEVNEYYANHDFVVFPEIIRDNDQVVIRANIIAPKSGRRLKPVRVCDVADNLPAAMTEYGLKLLEAIGVSQDGTKQIRGESPLFRDLGSMQLYAQIAKLRGTAPRIQVERRRLMEQWYEHDPACPFLWRIRTASWFRSSSESPSTEKQSERDEPFRQEAEAFTFVPPYNAFMFRGDRRRPRIPGVPSEPTPTQMMDALRRCSSARDVRTFLVVKMGIAGQWLTAESLLRPIERLEPDVWQWKKLRGLLLGWQGRFAEAAEHWAQCARTSPDGHVDYVTLYGTDPHGSRRWIKQWIPIAAMLGYDLVRSGQWAEGADVLERSLRELVNGKWPEAQRTRTLLVCAAMYALCHCEQPQRALELYEHCRTAIKDWDEVKYHLARVHLLLGKRARARRLLHEAESLASDLGVPLEGAFVPTPYELDCFRRELQHHRSVFGL